MLTSKFIKTAGLCLVLAFSATTAAALPVDRSPATMVFAAWDDAPDEATQSNCTSLSQAVDQVRRRGNVERVISAETRVSGGREVHYIKVLTKDGKVRTHTVNGCKR